MQAALSKHFSLFGALQFESDAGNLLCSEMKTCMGPEEEHQVRAICSFFTSVSEQAGQVAELRLESMGGRLSRQALRHKFARLFEMSSLSRAHIHACLLPLAAAGRRFGDLL